MNSKKTKPGSEAPQFEFIIRREFNAPRDRVWRPEPNSSGMVGTKRFRNRLAQARSQTWRHLPLPLEVADGADMWGKLVFREIVPEERVVFIVSFSDEAGGVTRHPLHEGWPLQILSTVTFAEAGAGKTIIIVRWVPHEATEAERKVFEDGKDSMQAGWTGTFERLDEYLAES